MTPYFSIIAAGEDITTIIEERYLSLTLTDEAGLKADSLDVRLDNAQGEIAVPSEKADIEVSLGYREFGALPMGVYSDLEATLSGPPDQMSIRCASANISGSLKSQKTRNWDGKSIRDIVATIASEHGLKSVVSEAHAGFVYEHLAQSGESDINLLTRIGKEHDALVSVKGGTLLFVKKGEGLSATGEPLPVVLITRQQVGSYRMVKATRGEFASVEAFWQDAEGATRSKVIVGSGEPVFQIRHNHPTKVEAEKAAQAKFDEMARGSDTLSLSMPGNPELVAEAQIVTQGFFTEVNGRWSITRVIHRIDSGGYTTEIEAEKPTKDGGESPPSV
ncbi:contractile injection system protein, VgrG/Pvc8 family [Paracoccaceae bacterium GXU_MW_L88]